MKQKQNISTPVRDMQFNKLKQSTLKMITDVSPKPDLED